MEVRSESQFNNFIENNYGSIYKTTGGGKKIFKGVNVNKWVKKIVGNRLFDLYLKYLGIKIMTTATLVPISLILSKDLFQSYIKKRGQTGGLHKKNLIILDDPLVGNYLKLAGLSVLDLSASTLLPLGTLMIIYDLYITSKKNNITGGGANLITGTSVPPGPFQKLNAYFNASPLPEPLYSLARKDPDTTNLQLSCSSGNCNVENNQIILSQGSSDRCVSNLNIPVEAETMTNSIKPQPSIINVDYSIPKPMAGGRRKSKKQLGSGSDWMSSQYSSGPVNSPKMSDYQFKVFNKTMMNNVEFAKQYQKVPQELKIDTPLYKQYYKEGGVPSSQFGGDMEPNELFKEQDVSYSVEASQFGGNISRSKINQLLDNQERKRCDIVKSILSSMKYGGGDVAKTLINMSKDKSINSSEIYKFFNKKDLIKQI